jgi:hypothetical protein
VIVLGRHERKIQRAEKRLVSYLSPISPPAKLVNSNLVPSKIQNILRLKEQGGKLKALII